MFSSREVQVLAGITRGKTNGQIATDLGLSELTIKTHVARILKRAGGSANRSALVTWGYRKGYLQGLSAEFKGTAPVMTNRELEVLQGVVHGWDNAYIGRRLFLTEDTIKTYVARLLRKWGAANRQHLTAFAWQAGVARETWWETPPVAEQGLPPVAIGDLPASVCPTCGSAMARILDTSAADVSGESEERV